MPLALKHHDPAVLARRKVLARSWAGIVIVWAIIRTIIVWAAVGDYGLNPWIYLAIDIASACVDAVTTPRMVLAFVDDEYKAAFKWAIISLVAFIIPDLYIFLGTRELPTRIIVVVCVMISLTLTAGIISVIRKVRAGRRAKAAAALDPMVDTDEVSSAPGTESGDTPSV
ncbi:MAG: hypothetical protein ACOYMR_15295 [Ilumatobacteraceae bacterium]